MSLIRRTEDRRAYLVRKEGITQIGEISENTNIEPINIHMTATTGVSYRHSATVSSNPVTSGNDRADHVTYNNDVVTLKGVISDTPQIFSIRSGYSREDYVSILNEIITKKELVDVFIFELQRPLRDCIITGLKYDKNKDLGDGLYVELNLKKILVGTPNTISTAKQEERDLVSEERTGGTKSPTTTPTEHPVNARPPNL